MDKKKVDIWVKRPCDIAHEPVHMTAKEIEMRIDDIGRNILIGNCVWEVLTDGGRLFLNMDNYDKDNSKAKATSGPLVGFDKENPILCAPAKKTEDKEHSEEESKQKQPADGGAGKQSKEEGTQTGEKSGGKSSPKEEKGPQVDNDLNNAKSALGNVVKDATQFKSDGHYTSVKKKNESLTNEFDKLIEDANTKMSAPKSTAKDLNAIAEQLKAKKQEIISADV